MESVNLTNEETNDLQQWTAPQISELKTTETYNSVAGGGNDGSNDYSAS